MYWGILMVSPPQSAPAAAGPTKKIEQTRVPGRS